MNTRFTIIVTTTLMCVFGQISEPVNAQKFQEAMVEEALIKHINVVDDAKFYDVIVSNPATIDYPLERLQNHYRMSLKKSSDGNVKIYSYLTGIGLNGCEYNIIQYKSEGKVFVTKDKWFHFYTCFDRDKEYVSDIKVITIDGKTYYLIFAGKYNGDDYGTSEFGVTAFTVENNFLVTAPLFKNTDFHVY